MPRIAYKNRYDLKKIDTADLAAWIKALRSGKYKQTQGDLRNFHGYCCLGVYCDVQAKEGKGAWDRMGNFAGGPQKRVGAKFPPLPMFNSGYVNPPLPYNGHWVECHNLNDSVKLSFEEIAKKLEGLLRAAKRVQREQE